jgi:hypothetical protein
MKKMYILMSHNITEQQIIDAKNTLNVHDFINLSSDIWSQIPVETESVESSLQQLKKEISFQAKHGDMLLVQGDYGATFNMVQFAKEKGIVPVYATSKRNVYEVVEGEKITTIREFQHVRFRKY